MDEIRIRTGIRLAAPPERVWPLLCSARMELPVPDCFRVGVPAPRECRTVGTPGPGATRECVSDRGVVRQRITGWEEGRRLAFERTSDPAGLDRLLEAMHDTFTLEPLPGGATRLTRTTLLRPRRRCGIEGMLLRLVVPHIHRYVHRNFRRLLERPILRKEAQA